MCLDLLAGSDEAECADTAAQDRNGFVLRTLRIHWECGEKIDTHGEQDHTSPENGRGFSNQV